MYTLIGADGHEYGPANAAQLQQWVAEGRANAQSLVQAEGTHSWRPLDSYPELAGLAAAVGVPPFIPGAPAVLVPGRKSKIAAGLLGILLGGWGVHRFYLGYIGIGIAQIFVTMFTCGLGALWGFIEGILILTGGINLDANGQPLQD
ncbi:NINE protein [bacterium]|nr:NINE protein [bacterium]